MNKTHEIFIRFVNIKYFSMRLVYFIALFSLFNKLNAQQIINVNINQSPCTSTIIKETTSQPIKITFNNSDKLVHIEFGNIKSAAISITTILGQQLYFQNNLSIGDKNIYVGDFRNGIYFINLFSSNTVVSQKIVLTN